MFQLRCQLPASPIPIPQLSSYSALSLVELCTSKGHWRQRFVERQQRYLHRLHTVAESCIATVVTIQDWSNKGGELRGREKGRQTERRSRVIGCSYTTESTFYLGLMVQHCHRTLQSSYESCHANDLLQLSPKQYRFCIFVFILGTALYTMLVALN